jgi:hypothetical protein
MKKSIILPQVLNIRKTFFDDGVWVSTVLIRHGLRTRCETMVFGGKLDDTTIVTKSISDSLIEHSKLVKKIITPFVSWRNEYYDIELISKVTGIYPRNSRSKTS